MSRVAVLCGTLFAAVLLTAGHTAPVPEKPKTPADDSPAQKIRRELNVAITLDLAGIPLPQAINLLKEKSGIDIVLDRIVLEAHFVDRTGNGGGGIDNVMITGKFNKTPLRRVLRNLLNEHDLGFVIVGEQLLVTSQALVPIRQVRQPVNVDLDKTPIGEALRKLARDTAVNLVIDSRIGKEADEKVSLQLDEVALDTAVKLLAEQAGLKVVLVDNVLFVTTKARAAEMRADPDFMPRDPLTGEKVDPRVLIPGGFAPNAGGPMGVIVPRAVPVVPLPAEVPPQPDMPKPN